MATMVPSALPPGASWISLISLLLFSCLLPPDAQGQAFQMRVELQPPAVLSGESILVNCSTDCPWAELVSLETSLLKELVGSGLGWAAFQLKNVTGDTLLFCYGFCNDSQIAAFSNITVYRFPERVELAPLPPWQPVGKRLLLSCLVSGGAPRDHLTVALFKGDEELGRQPAAKGEPTEVTVTVLASRDDHGANFSCRTELDLRSQGLGLFQNSSAPRKLQTFAMPMTPPRLVVSRFSEVETSLPVECTLDGLFPASEAQVQLVLGDQSLNPTVVSHGDTLTATATAKAAQEGVHKIVCKVTLGGKSLETRENVTVYSRNPLAVTITLAVLAILGLVIVAAALMYVFGVKKSRLPLRPRQPEEAAAAVILSLGLSGYCKAEAAGGWRYPRIPHQ
uniref:Intercellular adhesion molecule 3 n=1 Tax=Catagonus wagneri TaxID=51154 RepID=A0A8C3VW85_9CETA